MMTSKAAESHSEARWARVRAIDAESVMLEVLGACDDATMTRYHAMRQVLEQNGVTIDKPGALAKRIEATIGKGDQLAELLKAERRYLLACDAADRFTTATKVIDKAP